MLNLESKQACQLAENGSPESGELLQAILDNWTAAISVKDIRGRYLLVNRRYETLFQVTAAQVVGRTDHDLFPVGFADALWGSHLRVLDAQSPLEFEEALPHGGGVHTYLSLKFPICGPTGTPYAVCAVSTDVTARTQAQRRLLAEHAVTRALADSLSLGDAVPRVLQAVCESLGWDMGLFWHVEPAANALRCVAVWQAPKVRAPAFERLSRQMTFVPGVGLPGRVWASGQPSWAADVGEDAGCRRSAAACREGLHGACGFPVRSGGEPLGVMEFFSHALREPDDDVLNMMISVGSQVGQFAERRQAEEALHERDREFQLARAIQQRRLPRSAPTVAGLDIAALSHPAQETGGDYLDFVSLADGSLGIAVGDASGHGIAAALLMAETRAYLRALLPTDPDLGEILARLNRHLAGDIGEDFVTLAVVRIEPRTRRLAYSSAGHWPGYVFDSRGEVRTLLQSTGMPLGLDKTGAFPAGTGLTLEPGELVLLLTDGIVEAASHDGPLFGAGRALESIRAHRGGPAGEIVAALFDEVRTFSQGVQTDDMTAVIIKVA